MHHSSARTGRLDATTSAPPSGTAAATSRAMRPSQRDVVVEHVVERAARAASRRPAADHCSARRRSRRGAARASATAASTARRSARTCSCALRCGIEPRVVGIDEHRRDAGEPRVRDLARDRRADAHDELGPVRRGERARSRSSASYVETRVRPCAVRERDRRGSASPRPRANRSATAESTPAPQPATTSPADERARARRGARRRRRRAAARGRWRAPTARRRRGRACRASGAPGGNERLAERQVEVHRPGGRTARVRDRAARQRAPARVRVGPSAAASGGPGIVEPAHRAAEQPRLVDGLARAPVAQLGRAVGGAHEQRHAGVVRLDDRRDAGSPPPSPTCSTRSRAARSRGRCRARGTRPSVRRARRRRASRPSRTSASVSGVFREPGDTTAAVTPSRDPLVDERPARTRSSTSTVAHRATLPAWLRGAESGARPRLHADRGVVARREPRSSHESCEVVALDVPTRDDLRRDRERARTRRASAPCTSGTRWAAGSRCGSRSTGPSWCRRSCWSARPPGIADDAARAERVASRRGAGGIGRTRRRRRVPRPLARATAVRERPADAPGLAERRGLSARLPRALPARARHGRDGTDVGPARASCTMPVALVTGRTDAKYEKIALQMLERIARRRRARAPRRRSRAPARAARRARRLHRVVRGAARLARPTGRSRAARAARAGTARCRRARRSSPGGSWRVSIARTGAIASGNASSAINALGTNAPHATTATHRARDARDVQSRARGAAPMRTASVRLPRHAIGVDVAHVVREQDPARRQPGRERGDPRDPGDASRAARTRCRRSRRTRRRPAPSPRRARCSRTASGPPVYVTAAAIAATPTSSSHGFTTSESTAPTTAATANDRHRGVAHGTRAWRARSR